MVKEKEKSISLVCNIKIGLSSMLLIQVQLGNILSRIAPLTNVKMARGFLRHLMVIFLSYLFDISILRPFLQEFVMVRF